MRDDVRACAHTLEGIASVGTVHGEVARALQVRSEEGDGIESRLGEKAELVREARKDRRDIHQAGVVGDEDVTGMGIEVFQTFHADPDPTGREQHLAPDAGDSVLGIASAVE